MTVVDRRRERAVTTRSLWREADGGRQESVRKKKESAPYDWDLADQTDRPKTNYLKRQHLPKEILTFVRSL